MSNLTISRNVKIVSTSLPKMTVATSATTFAELKTELNASFDKMTVVIKDVNGNRISEVTDSTLLPTVDFAILASATQMKGATL